MMNGNEITKTKNISKLKRVAKWFLGILSVMLVCWAYNAYALVEYIFTNKGFMQFFVISFFLILICWILMLSILVKNRDSMVIRTTKIKLILVFVFAILPATILFLLFLFFTISTLFK